MAVSINPVVPAVTLQGGSAPTLVLQPGSVIDARVLSVLDANLVQIAIANMSVTVQSEVPLQAGMALQLAVSQTASGGIQLAIVPADASAAQASSLTGAANASASSAATDTSAIARSTVAGNVAAAATLTPAEAAAVASATQAAAARQSGLSSLFANVAATVDALPAPLQQAAAQLLAARPALTTALDATDIQSAFENSGLFLEAGLAGGLAMPGQAGGPPDLKAALLVFRELLSSYADESSAPSSAEAVAPAAAVVEVTDATAHGAGPGASLLATQAGAGETLGTAVLLAGEGAATLVPGGPGQTATTGSVFNILQEVEGALTSQLGTVAAAPGGAANASGLPRGTLPLVTGAAVPPPPYRGAAPVPQSVASPSIAPDAAPRDVVQRLTADTDGAIARQTLLQIASLPGHADASAVDRTVPRWNFEVPFSTPQGTAVAQFEISGDGGGQAAGSSHRVWRARFTLNVEPTGPVHAVVSLAGGTTSVRMWAERPQTATQLRANASQLSVALRQAELEPGDIVIGDGAPPLPAMAAPAGHFLDRAT